MSTIKMLTVAGARPQFVKVAVVSRYLRQNPGAHRIEEVLVHTGQHYDEMMSDVFFKELEIQPPRYSLDVGSGSPGQQLAKMMERLEGVIKEENPDVTLVYGDTNSTIAAALVSTHHNIPVVHVEAGERIYRRRDVPEEINRILTDHIASLNLTSTRRAGEYLQREGMADRRVRFVGDTMYELFVWARDNIDRLSNVTPASFGVEPGHYHIATIHRAENTKTQETLLQILNALDRADEPVVLPIHPRIANLIKKWDYAPTQNLKLIEPLGYLDFIRMLLDCSRVITDSGGVTRESFFARKPCIVPMDNSWWTEIAESGWAICVGTDPNRITNALNAFTPKNEYPENLFGDGHSAMHIVDEVTNFVEYHQKHVHWHKHGSYVDLPRSEETDFTYANYRKLITTLKDSGYTFAHFSDSKELLAKGTPYVLMRHDIDLDLDKAAAMARVEAELGIVSTYFFMVRNDFYNIFSKDGTTAINEVLKLGHRIGLHFDCAAYPDNFSTEEYAEACARESNMLADWFGQPVEIVSYHRPNEKVLSGDLNLSAPLPHTYEPHFTKEIAYCSDSMGKWRYGSPIDRDAFAEKKPLHILVHPIWWHEQPIAGYPALLRLVDGKAKQLEHDLAANCVVFRVGDRAEMKDS